MYERIKNLRVDKDLTQTQVATYLNCSQRITKQAQITF
jgi:transcriptional regulator with XRE-family HTH domain